MFSKRLIPLPAHPLYLLARLFFFLCVVGTGKTAAFSLPTLQYLFENEAHRARHQYIRTLILSPTRELASQVSCCRVSLKGGGGAK